LTDLAVTPVARGRLLRSRFTLTLIALILAFLFIRLGFWQLERANEKQTLRSAIEARAQLSPLALQDLPSVSEALRFRKIVVRGIFEPQHQILLDNRTYQGRAGYHVITPLRISDTDRRVLVNRGWIEMGKSRDVLPIDKPPPGEVEVHGIIEILSCPPNILGMIGKPNPSWGKRWPYLDIDYFQTQAGYALEPFLILEDRSDPGGLVRIWPQLEIDPTIHTAYAIQWFAFATIVLIVYSRLVFGRPKTQEI
jgi:surfeit locus 1 family protein